jgi:glycosyltransferase Alg8
MGYSHTVEARIMKPLNYLPSTRRFEGRATDFFNLLLYGCCLYLLIHFMSAKSTDLFQHRMIILVAAIGIWRYSWWFLNLIRALIYEFIHFPPLRRHADELYKSGWKPPHIYFVIASYKEQKETTEALLHCMLRECKDLGVPATLYLSATPQDEKIVRNYVRQHVGKIPFQVVAIRQTLPDKRIALGQCLRSLSRHGVIHDTPIILMDGDALMTPNTLRKCVPFFHLNPKLDALTTDEKAIFYGPRWMAEMTELRFAQRHLMMQSHALSKRVLTLTGRLSMFRSQMITSPEFITRLENDYLDHWLWGRFRFLSGDDKSTWYLLLKRNSEMFYVRDTLVYTVEHITGNGLQRTVQNLLRWSGNMLRNNGRAIALGPKKVPPYIWWCLIDQRLVIWTSLVSPIAALLLTAKLGGAFISVYLAWLGITRMGISLFIFRYAGRINLAFPFLIYSLQISTAIIKIYILFRLPRQRWTNRTNATRNQPTKRKQWKENLMANYLTLLYPSALVIFLAIYTGTLSVSSWADITRGLRQMFGLY